MNVNGSKARGKFEALDPLADVRVVNRSAATIANRHDAPPKAAKDCTEQNSWQAPRGWPSPLPPLLPLPPRLPPAQGHGSPASSFLIRSPYPVPKVACFVGSPRYGSTNGPPLFRMSRSPQPTRPNSRIRSDVEEESGTT